MGINRTLFIATMLALGFDEPAWARLSVQALSPSNSPALGESESQPASISRSTASAGQEIGASAHPAGDGQIDPTAVFRAPLLREGSYLLEARSVIERDPKLGWWRLLTLDNEAGRPAHDLVLLPCTRLSEMQHIVEAAPSRRVEFLITGKLFAFRGQNYILPTHAPVVMEQERTVAATAPDDARVESGPVAGAPPAQAAKSTETRETVADIMRGIEEATGPLTRSGGSPAIERPAPARGAHARAQNTLPEETSVAERRGTISRDGGGGWMFVFDADASGLSDPPVRLLPCLLLERIEDYARRQGNNSPAILSGPIYLYNTQNYLLPTVFRIPQDRRNISP